MANITKICGSIHQQTKESALEEHRIEIVDNELLVIRFCCRDQLIKKPGLALGLSIALKRQMQMPFVMHQRCTEAFWG